MLATSSSDDEDYNTPNNKNAIKKPPAINTPSINNNKSPFSTGPKLNNNNYSQPATPNISNRNNSNASNNYNNSLNSTTNAIQNVNLNNGGDTYSVHSSFSVSSENISLNNYNGNNRNRNNLQQQQQQNSSFKSNSSTSTLGQNVAGGGGGGGYPPQTNSNLNTPRSKPRNQNQSKPRSGSRRPGGGDNASYASSNLNGDYDSDNSDYNFDSHYANQQQQQQNTYQYQNSDDEDNNNENENENENYDNSSSIVSSSNNRSNNSKNKNNNKISEEEQQAALLQAQQNEAMKELENHKKRLQVYVFVCRCVAYPFIAKQPTDMVRRQLKITKQQLQTIKDNFESFLNNKITNIEADEAFTNAVRSYYEVFLKSDRVNKIVLAGGCTSGDFRDVFKNNIEKRVRSLPEIDGLSKETVLTSWMNKYDSIFRYNEEHNTTNIIANRRHSRNLNHPSNPLSSECILTKEQLYDLFQNILGIKKFEHQQLFNAAQVYLIFLFKFHIINYL
jgi:hypothetical protein